jgi:D-glycero-D-manno-heptose 1,7-bisphosphate phosphatase
MIEFHGRPFLEYLIEMLRDQGFQRVLLLLGYLPHVVTEHFGDGSRWGIAIEYSITPPEDETGLRLSRVLDRLDPTFLLLYCDNYWPMPFDQLWQTYTASSAEMLVTVYRNTDGYTRDNLRLGAGGLVETYDKSRTAPNLKGVDIGFMIVRRDTIATLPPDANISLEATLYPRLVAQRKLVAFPTDHRYYSVGDHKRLPVTAEFLAFRPTVFLDRDGVLNRKMPRAEYVRSWSDWTWLPGTREAVARFTRAGWQTIVITNQAGIARGMMTEDDLNAIHARMTDEIAAAGGRIDAIYHCPHHWDAGCDCRKPKPGMLFQAQQQHHIDLSRAMFVGDDERDAQAAEAAGCRFAGVTDTTSLIDIVERLGL